MRSGSHKSAQKKLKLGRFKIQWLAMAASLVALSSLASPPSGYYQVWNDEFDGNSLNGNNWVTYTGSHRDAVNTASALSIGNSDLTITTYTSGGTHYTGFVGTQGKFYSKFGYYEAYIDWADSPGMWSAFWLQSDYMDDCPYPSSHIGDTLTYGAEVDVVEHRSQNSSGTSIANQGVSNIHWDGYTACGGNDSSTGSSLYGSGLNSGYHTYGLLWDSSNYRFYVDGSQVYSTGSGNSEHSEWIVLSSEVLNGGWSGNIPSGGYGSSGSSSTKMRVAYVRYYAPNSMVFWDGSNTAYWTNSANWVAGKSVPSGGTVVFSLLSKGNYTTILGQDYTLDTLTILESSFITIKSNTLTLNTLLDMNSAWNDASIQSDMILGGGNTWRVGGGRTLRAQGNISGGHSLWLGGYGTVALYGNNSYTLGTTIDRGTLRMHSDTALGTGAASVSSGAQLLLYTNVNGTNALSLNGTGPSGDGAMRVGAGASATWSGPINLANAATIKLDGGTALNIAGSIGGAHTLTLAGDSGSSGAVSGNINTGSFAVNKAGGGTWTLSGNNSFTGALNVDSGSTTANDGALRIAGNGAVGTAASIQIRNNSGIGASSTLQLDGSSGPLAISQTISLSGRNNSVPAIQNLAGSNTLSGALSINVGGSDYRFQSDADTLVLAGRVFSAASGTRTLTFQGAGNILVSGVITNGSAGTLNLTKSGPGTLTLAAANTYTGATTNTGGTILLAPGGSISNSTALFLDNGAVFDSSLGGGFALGTGQFAGGNGAIVGNVSALNGSKISPGTTAGTLAFSNNLTLGGGVTNYFDLANDTVEGSGTNDLIVVNGDLNLSGTNVILITPTVGSLANGRYKLIKYAGARTGGATNFIFAFNGFAPIATMNVDDSVTNEIDLVVFANPASLVWQGDGAANNWDIAGAANWFNGITSTQFNLGDKVTFDDSSTNRTVNLVGGIAASALTVNSSGNYTFQGAGKLTGASGLVKSNAATLILLTTNNYSGPTTIANGTLQVGNGTASGTLGTGSILDNGTLVFNHPDTITLPNTISGTGSLSKAGAGTLNLSGNNSFAGGVVQSGGTINASNNASLGTGPVLLTNLQLQLAFTTGASINNDITVGGPMGVVGTGAIKGPASGSATINGAIAFTVKSPNGGATTNGGAFDGGNTTGGLILNGPLSSPGGGAIHLRANRITVSGGGSYNLFQDSGTLVLGLDNGLATNSVLEIGSSAAGTFDLAGFGQTLNGLQKGPNAATVGNSSTATDSMLTISGVTSNTTFAGTIQNAVSGGTRKVALTVAVGTFTLSAANTFSGDTRLVGGTLVLGNGSAIQNSTLDMAEDDQGTISFGISNATFGGLKGTRALALTNASSANVALIVGNGNTNTYTYSGSLSGGGSVTKTGSGTFILNGVNTFTNVLNVDTAQPSSGNDGVLRLASPDALDGASSIAIRNQNAATSTLQLDGSSGVLTLAQPISLNGRNPASVSIENLSGDNTLLGNISFGSGGTNYYFQSDSGTLTLSGVVGVHGLTSPRLIAFQGTGNFLLTGYITNSAVTNANILVKNGAGTLTLAGTNLYLGTTTINGGALLVNGLISTNTTTVNAGGTLGGSGNIRGAVAVQASATLSPGAISGVTRTLTISNTLTLAGTSYMALDPTGGTNDSVRGLSTVTYGGLLMLTNLSGSYSSNNIFKLFSATTYVGAFTNVVPATPAPGFAWNTNTLTTDGTLRIVQTAASTPTNIDFSVSGNQLALTWPTNYLGWRLQYQTNDLSTGLGTNWLDVPVSNTTNQFIVPVDTTAGSVFYRLVFP